MIIEEIHGAGQPHVLEYMHIRLRVHELHQLFDKWRRKVNNDFLLLHNHIAFQLSTS